MHFKLRTIILLSFLLLLDDSKVVVGRSIFEGENIFDFVRDAVTGVGEQFGKLFPKPHELWDVSRQVFIGLPEMAVFGAIHELCSLYVASERVHPRFVPEMDQMYFQLRTPCKYKSFPIKSAQRILESPLFDINKKVVLFVSGWTSTVEADNIANMAKAYNCRGDYNYLALNASHFIDTLYTWSAFNTEEVGRIVAFGLKKLHRKVPAKNIHLVGFSLGAHIVGAAGRYFKEFTGDSILRITGLDPANPCFNEGEYLAGLQRGDADFVDVIHTNPGGLGKREQLGDADFYVSGFMSVKPGCFDAGCSHSRAWQYYSESVYPGHENDFLATRCSSLRKVKDGICSGLELPMGHSVPFNTKGTYILDINHSSPFGLNAYDDDDIIASECGLCEAK